MASPESSPDSSPLGSSTVSPASSPTNSELGTPEPEYTHQFATSPPLHHPSIPFYFRNSLPPAPLPPPPAPHAGPSPPHYQQPQPFYHRAPTMLTASCPGFQQHQPQQPSHTKYAQINTPYDFLVPYEYFSTPQGFKPYHFRQCYMPTLGTYVIVEKGWSTQLDLDTWSPLLLRMHNNCHVDSRGACCSVSSDDDSSYYPTTPSPRHRPKVQVCPLLSTEMQRAIDRAPSPTLEREDPKLFTRLGHLSEVESKVVFFIVVQQGAHEDGAVGRLVVKGSFYQIMTEIFYSASNGLDVAFSGVIREKDLERLGRGYGSGLARFLRWGSGKKKAECGWEKVRSKLRFKRVESYDDLMEDDGDKNVIRVGC